MGKKYRQSINSPLTLYPNPEVSSAINGRATFMTSAFRVLLFSGAILIGISSPSFAQSYGDGSCASWQRTCAEMWGGGTSGWQQCMRQPGAVYACNGGYAGNYGRVYGGRGAPYTSRNGSCAAWRRTC